MGENMIREPAVAGAFYESNVKYLRESIEDCFKHRLGPKELPKLSRINKEKQVNAIMVPHAGYVYSGPTAAHAYSKLVKDGYPETFVILCPNHTGYGADVSVYNEGSWVVPNGVCDVDNELADEIIKNSNFAKADFKAHLQEHSCEVQLPFLKYFDSNFKIVPICMMDQSVETANTEGLYQVVKKEQITICGYGPTMVSMEFSKKLGQKNFELLQHTTSGDITLDYASVVGYGSGVWY